MLVAVCCLVVACLLFVSWFSVFCYLLGDACGLWFVVCCLMFLAVWCLFFEYWLRVVCGL